MAKLSWRDLVRVQEMYLGGMTTSEIGAVFGVTNQAISLRVQQMGLGKGRARPALSERQVREAVQRYRAGETMAVIAASMGVSAVTIGKHLSQQGVQRRSLSPVNVERLREMFERGESDAEIGQAFGVCSGTIAQHRSALGLRRPTQHIEVTMDDVRSRVAVTDGGCWMWPGTGDTAKNYGSIRSHGRHWPAHRFVASLVHGDVTGKQICHRCDRPGCVNPDHLWIGSREENMADMAAKGKQRGSRNAQSKLTEESAAEVRGLHASGVGRKEIARRYGVSVSTVAGVLSGRYWKAA